MSVYSNKFKNNKSLENVEIACNILPVTKPFRLLCSPLSLQGSNRTSRSLQSTKVFNSHNR